MMDKPLLDAAQESQPGFTKPDITPYIPKGQEDAVARIKAAGMRYMYSPEMKDEVAQAIRSDEPMAKKLGQNVAGLILTLDQQTQEGLPIEAMYPAAVELLGEAAEMTEAAGQKVSQEDFNDAMLVVMVELARRMGADDEQIMAEAGRFAGGQGEGDPTEQAPPEAAPMPQPGAPQ